MDKLSVPGSKRSYLLVLLLICSLSPLNPSLAAETLITRDPHRTDAGFFDIHICNWPGQPPFYLSLFGTEQFDDITAIEIFTPDGDPVGQLDLGKFTISKDNNKPERRVFITHLPIPESRQDGWHQAEIHFNDGSRQSAQDFIIHQTIGRADNHSPGNGAEDIPLPKKLSWDSIAGALYYKVFIRDLWDGGKLIHTSGLLTDSSLTLPQGLIKAGGYYAWRVHARDINEHVQLGDFNAGSLSPWVEFSVAE